MIQKRSAEDAERLLYQLARSDPDVLWLFSPDWSELQFGDEAYEEVWGRSLDELVDDPTAFLEGIHPDDREEVLEAMEALSNEQSAEVECRVLPEDTLDTREVWMEGRPVYDGDGEFVAIAGCVRDVTERKRYERRLERTNERLEAVNGFLSHDLRNQLQTAMGFLRRAREQHPEGSGHLERVAESLERMEEMTSAVLEHPRLDRADLEREATSLRTLATDSWETRDSGGARLCVDGDVTLHVDADLFQHVFENLFQNAIEHTGAPVTVRVGPLSDGRGFYVADDGDGVPDDTDVFEFGVSAGGSGVGLALVREVVESHGGTVDVTESVDGGARFEVRDVALARDEATKVDV